MELPEELGLGIRVLWKPLKEKWKEAQI
jgi:hypothetical protein